ncbi:MAG: hypothetical protein DU429_08080 [Candidatus Tokpelaia sp.]|nr:MAG: hypothetical protein DU430_08490 [Candidatus Tokpelaia sp.]KAA6205398.1 MAG: hypothetical protein DU429_08080 [Candidatus Tokpelaia sp.]
MPQIHESPAEQQALNQPDSRRLESLIKDLTIRVQDLEAGNRLKKQAIIDIQAYITDLKKDLNWIKWIRFSAVLFAAAYVISINLLLGYLIFFLPDYFKSLSPYTQAMFIIAGVSSVMGVLVTVLNGAFKIYNERHKEDYLPPNLQAIIKIFDMVQKSTDIK